MQGKDTYQGTFSTGREAAEHYNSVVIREGADVPLNDLDDDVCEPGSTGMASMRPVVPNATGRGKSQPEANRSPPPGNAGAKLGRVPSDRVRATSRHPASPLLVSQHGGKLEGKQKWVGD